MYEVRQFLDWGLVVVVYAEPFSSADLIEAVPAVGTPGNGEGRHRALLVDIRQVSVSGVSSTDSRKLVAARKALLAGTRAEPAAFLIRSSEDFAYIRMHNLWSEAMGLRDEARTIITANVGEALAWLSIATEQPGLAEAMLPHLTRA